MRNLALFLIALTVQGQSVAAQGTIRPVSAPVKLVGELAADVANIAPALNGRRIYYGTRTGELWLYDVAAKRSTKIADDVRIVPTAVSAQGDRIAFMRSADGGSLGQAIWTLPLDRGTGLAAGPARRASVGNGARPSLSPDGKWIAFESLTGRRHLAVIPSDGGSERVLLGEVAGIEYIKWTPDQRWLYFSAVLPGGTRGRYLPMRIAVAGGKPELIAEDQFPFVDGEVGLSPDGRLLGVTVRAASTLGALGDEPGALVLALMDVSGKPIAMLPWADAWLSSSELLLWYSYRLKPLKSISLLDGTVREVLPASYDIGTPVWSADGRRFAVMSQAQRGGGHPDSSKLLIANADGSNIRAIAVRASKSQPVWSPDGRWIAITERAWLGAQNDLFGLGIIAVEVASGRTRRLRTAVSEYIASVRWADDSRHVLYDHSPYNDNPTVFRPVIRKVGLDGSDVVVRTLPSRGPGTGPAFISDTSVIVSDSSGTFVRSLTSDRFVRVWMGPLRPAVSPRGDLLVLPGDTAERTRRNAEILTPAGGRVASVSFPSDLVRSGGGTFLFTPDGKHVLTWGRSDAAKGCCKLYVAPIDGGPIRTLVEFPDVGTPDYALSPDGRTLLFVPSGTARVVTMWSVDLSGVLRGASKN